MLVFRDVDERRRKDFQRMAHKFYKMNSERRALVGNEEYLKMGQATKQMNTRMVLFWVVLKKRNFSFVLMHDFSEEKIFKIKFCQISFFTCIICVVNIFSFTLKKQKEFGLVEKKNSQFEFLFFLLLSIFTFVTCLLEFLCPHTIQELL